MKKHLLKLLMMSFLVCLSSCKDELYHVAEQCAPAFAYVDETKKLIDADKSFCSVRKYEFSANHVGPLSGTDSKRPIDYCDRCVGFKNYAATATFWQRVRKEIVNQVELEHNFR
jgi:hypothetical protein